ncbi:MAG TPA: DUF309 domain-containing protein, partial [Longimicrobiales bacterium]|nr:DUF309 domain-containing protein [Longimicrobiales bacterium]
RHHPLTIAPHAAAPGTAGRARRDPLAWPMPSPPPDPNTAHHAGNTAPATAAEVDPAFGTFLDLFNRGEFWESHEALEAAWRATGSEFYHALILFASAFVHVRKGNRHGIAAQLGKAEPLFERRRPHYLGIDVDALLAHSAICRHLVAENRDAPDDAWSVLIPIPRIAFDPARVRGDEPELDP